MIVTLNQCCLFICTVSELWVAKMNTKPKIGCSDGGGGGGRDGFHTTMQMTMDIVYCHIHRWCINIIVKSPSRRCAIPKHNFIQLMRTDDDFSSLSMYVYGCMRTHIFVLVWLAGWLHERTSERASERVRACEYMSVLIAHHAYWFCYMGISIYRSLASSCCRLFFLRAPILSTIRLNTFSWNFIVDRFKSCLFFSLLNIAVAAAAASIRSKRNLTKRIIPFSSVARIYTWYSHPNVIFTTWIYLYGEFCVRSKQNCDSKFSEVYRGKGKGKRSRKTNTSHFLGISKRRQQKISLDFLHVLLHGVPRDEKSSCTMWKTEKFKHTNFEHKQTFQKWMDNFFYEYPIHIKEK